VPRHGLSLAALAAFATQHAGRTHSVVDSGASGSQELAFERLTTAHVCEALVKPATLRTGAHGASCTYAELLLSQARAGGPACRVTSPLTPFAAPEKGACDATGCPFVAAATRFVSHAWSGNFADLLAALKAHAEHAASAGQEPYYWIGARPSRTARSCAC
jgi:hypothetical protein